MITFKIFFLHITLIVRPTLNFWILLIVLVSSWTHPVTTDAPPTNKTGIKIIFTEVLHFYLSNYLFYGILVICAITGTLIPAVFFIVVEYATAYVGLLLRYNGNRDSEDFKYEWNYHKNKISESFMPKFLFYLTGKFK